MHRRGSTGLEYKLTDVKASFKFYVLVTCVE